MSGGPGDQSGNTYGNGNGGGKGTGGGSGWNAYKYNPPSEHVARIGGNNNNDNDVSDNDINSDMHNSPGRPAAYKPLFSEAGDADDVERQHDGNRDGEKEKDFSPPPSAGNFASMTLQSISSILPLPSKTSRAHAAPTNKSSSNGRESGTISALIEDEETVTF